MSLVDPIVLLRKLGELHRPVCKPHPEANEGTFLIQCPACDGPGWKVWVKGDPAAQCEYWAEYSAHWLAVS